MLAIIVELFMFDQNSFQLIVALFSINEPSNNITALAGYFYIYRIIDYLDYSTCMQDWSFVVKM